MTTLTKKEKDLLARQDRLQQQLEQTRQALAQKERQRAKRERELERARDTRRRILIGAYMMSIKTTEELSVELNGYLTRKDDRELFGLEPLEIESDIAASQLDQEKASPGGFATKD